MTSHFSIGQRVIARNYTGNSKWVPGIVRAQLGPLSYEVEIGPNLVWRRHTDQLKDSNAPVTDNHTPVFHPLPFPALIHKNHGDQVAEPTERIITGGVESAHRGPKRRMTNKILS